MPSRSSLSRSIRRTLVAVLAFCAASLPLLLPGRQRAAVAAAPGAPYEPGVVVVGFKPHATVASAGAALARTGIARATESGNAGGNFTTVLLRPHVSVAQAVARLRRRGSVAWAVPDYIAHAAGVPAPAEPSPFVWDDTLVHAVNELPTPFDPDDPGNTGLAGGWTRLQWNFVGRYGVNAPQAWANLIADGHPGGAGAGVIVAVLDTGVAYANHWPFVRSPDFMANEFVAGHDFVAHKSSFPEDRNGHGTQVAGTIAEATNNGVGVTGLAYGVRLMPVRVLDAQGNGGATTIADGIRFAVAHGAQIINLSLEFTAGTIKASSIPELISAIHYALSQNVLVVAASGNEGVGELSYPAKIKGVVAVGATTPDGCLGYYSNYGSGLTLVAPGGGADADVPGDAQCMPNSTSNADIYQETYANIAAPRYRSFGLPAGYFGTSMAAPHVSATAALIIASGVLGPHPTVAEIVNQLTATATKLGPPGGDPRYYGAGLVNAAAATEPIGTTGPTGPTGSTGVTGS